jgi:3-hydroxyacyl-CoA dehydrogenase
VIAGTGKMARDVGFFFLGRGHHVAWLSRDTDRLAVLESWVRRRIRRLADLQLGLPPGDVGFFQLGDRSIPRAEVFIESINEDQEEKQQVLEALDGIIPAEALRLTNSSSILPALIHPRCAGLHFFYPVEITGFVEAVIPDGFSDHDRQRLMDLLAESDLECIEEVPRNAFAVNRLLMPVQNECFRALMAGRPADEVDEASISSLLPVGQLALIDNIGLDVVYPAVCNFTDRMEPGLAIQYTPLRKGLFDLLEIGKLGHKNKNGLCRGGPLPWAAAQPGGVNDQPFLKRLIPALFVNTCFHALQAGLISAREQEVALCALFGWDRSLGEVWLELGQDETISVLEQAYDRWRAWYFIPTHAMRPQTDAGRRWPDHGPVI